MNHYLSLAIIDSQSNILYHDGSFKQVFKFNKTVYDSLSYKDRKTLTIQDKQIFEHGNYYKNLFINIFSENFTLNKTPCIYCKKIVGINMILEPFYINSVNKIFSQNIKLHPDMLDKHKKITGYSTFQKEIIFCLLFGIHSDKSIARFIENRSKINSIEPRAVKDSIQVIFKKIFVNDRDELIFYLHYLNFDKYVPNTLFPTGLYYDLQN